MDEGSLRRLADEGVAAFPPTALGDLVEWCWSFGEETGNARYLSLSQALKLIDDLFADCGACPTASVDSLSRLLRTWLPAILDAVDPADGTAFARLLRQQLLDDVTWARGK
jgi:hypothetical protein